jgi:hypothetical protein
LAALQVESFDGSAIAPETGNGLTRLFAKLKAAQIECVPQIEMRALSYSRIISRSHAKLKRATATSPRRI